MDRHLKGLFPTSCGSFEFRGSLMLSECRAQSEALSKCKPSPWLHQHRKQEGGEKAQVFIIPISGRMSTHPWGAALAEMTAVKLNMPEAKWPRKLLPTKPVAILLLYSLIDLLKIEKLTNLFNSSSTCYNPLLIKYLRRTVTDWKLRNLQPAILSGSQSESYAVWSVRKRGALSPRLREGSQSKDTATPSQMLWKGF